MLDKDFEAVVGDFGLARLMDYRETHVTTAVRGTIGHIAPEYLSSGFASDKTDVFGYGVMLLELITGQRAFDLARLANSEDVMLLDWVRIESKPSTLFASSQTLCSSSCCRKLLYLPSVFCSKSMLRYLTIKYILQKANRDAPNGRLEDSISYFK